MSEFTELVKPFIEYKGRLGEAQASGELRSLVWPLFFDHTRHEAERWERRLTGLGAGESEFEPAEVVRFWTNIMDEHVGCEETPNEGRSAHGETQLKTSVLSPPLKSMKPLESANGSL